MPTLRRATRADRKAVLAFHRALYVEHRGSIAPAGATELYAYKDLGAALADDVDSLLAREDALVLLAEESGVPIGYVTGRIELDPRRVLSRRGVIEDWLVVETHRGRGIGRLLLETLLDIFREAGCEVAESTTQAFNPGSRAAHTSLGFTEIEVKYRKRI